jgi:hypothetical protein
MRPSPLLGDDPFIATDTRRRQMTTVAQPGTARIHTVQGGGGLRLHVREWGTADGPPILFIHGLPRPQVQPASRKNGVTNNTPHSTRYGSRPALGQLKSLT